MKHILSKSGVAALLLVGAGVTLPVQAHGVWVAQRAGEWALVLGESGADDEYRPDAVKQVIGHTQDGTAREVTVRARERNVALAVPKDVTTLGASFEDGFWSETPQGKWVSGPRSKVPDAKKVGYYMMFTRTVMASGEQRAKALGQPLEIVPQSDPMKLHKGAKLRVRVQFEGAPLAGASLISDYLNDSKGRKLKTDAQGYAEVTIRSSGLNVIKASHAVARKDRTEADEDGYAATLAFALPHSDD